MTGRLERHRTALTVGLGAVFLIVAGRYAYGGIWIYGREVGWVTTLRGLLLVAAVFLALSILGVFVGAVNSATGNGKASMGQGLIFSSMVWIASDRAELDWRAIRWMAAGCVALVVAVLVPRWVWDNAPLVGGCILAGQAAGWFWTELFTDQPRWLAWWTPPVKEETTGWGRDARRIRRDWSRMVQDLMSRTEGPVKTKVKAPKLIDVIVTELSIRLVVEPPSMWDLNGLTQLATAIRNEWGGVSSDVRLLPDERMRRRRWEIQVVMKPLPDTEGHNPYPHGDTDGGAPLGITALGDIIRFQIGPRGVPHILVAGQSGSGKSSAMRVIGMGMVAAGADVYMIDPKREGDLDGISPNPTMFRAEDWVRHFDWLLEEQERRAEIKQRGGWPGRPIVTMVDELTRITTGIGARSEEEMKEIQRAHRAYMACVLIGRGTSIHIVTGIQQASAEGMGGKMATAVRDQHLGRVLLGRFASKQNREMVLGDLEYSKEDVEAMMDAPAGRAWVGGMSGPDNKSVECVQVFNIPEAMAAKVKEAEDEAGGVSATSPHPTLLDEPTSSDPEPSTRESDRVPSLRWLLAEYLHEHGPTPRPVLRDVTDPPVPDSTLRKSLRALRDQGYAAFEDGSPSGNTPVMVSPAGEWPPAADPASF